MTRIYVAVHSAVFTFEGKATRINKGKTYAEEGHPILSSPAGRLFAPVEVKYVAESKEEVETSPATPRRAGRRRSGSPEQGPELVDLGDADDKSPGGDD